MSTYISNTIKFYKVEHIKRLWFDPPVCFKPFIVIRTDSNERVPWLSINITDQEKEICSFIIPWIQWRAISTCSLYDSFIAKKGYIMGDILKESVIIEFKEAIAKKEESHEGGKVEIWELWHEQDQLIKSAMSLFEN